MKDWRRAILRILLFGIVLCSVDKSLIPLVKAYQPEDDLSAQVETIFTQLSAAERMGQLFIVTFDGTEAPQNSHVAQLIRDYRIGGVWLQAQNKIGGEQSAQVSQMKGLISQLQTLTHQVPTFIVSSTLTTTATSSNLITHARQSLITPTNIVSQVTPLSVTPIPLFISIDHEGNGPPYTLLTSELSELPSQMTLGATWNPEYTLTAGRVAGQELSSLGINMLFGPVLDVVDKPRVDLGLTVGVRTFGGDPYWVGKHGLAYITGIHEGSVGKLLTIAKHFPGAGGIDRRLNQEVPTIQKSLVQLQQIELAPFYAVTNIDDHPAEAITDGLMTAHIRYRGLQGNIRELTQPISLDTQRLPIILSSSNLAPWRENGGLVVSGPLGSEALVKTYRVDENDSFPAKRIALDAFLAGNDILLLSDFGLPNDDQDQFENIVATITFFQDRYETDPDFQHLVDQAVRRILRAKFKIYNDFSLETVTRPPSVPSDLTASEESINDILPNAVTLIDPGPAEIAERIPSPPLRDEEILIFTDDRQIQACAGCEAIYLLDPDIFAQKIINRYGPSASDQISPEQISSFTFSDLTNAFNDNVNTDDGSNVTNIRVRRLLRQANWLIFVMLDIDEENYPSSGAVKQFLRSNVVDLRDKKIIVFAFDAPYYLGNTEVSLLTAYYGLYGKTQKHIETAVRLLFKEFEAIGKSPVNIDAVAYNLISALEPDPDQVITIDIHKETSEAAIDENVTSTSTPEPPSEEAAKALDLQIEVGDRLTLQTGLILDKNGNPVPDNTLISFNLAFPGETLRLAPIIVGTIDGIAKTTISVDREGVLEITAESGRANRSTKYILGGPNPIVENPPSPVPDTPTLTPSPTHTLIPSPTLYVTPTPTASATSTPLPRPPTPQIAMLTFEDLIYSLFALGLLGGIIFGFLMPTKIPLENRVWPVLIAFAAGLVGYVLYGILAVQWVDTDFVAQFVRSNSRIHWLVPLGTVLFALGSLGLIYIGYGLTKLYRHSIKDRLTKQEENQPETE